MQLELVGCTGAGKSTLAARIVETARADGVEIVLADDVALQPLGMGNSSRGGRRAAAIHFVAFAACLTHGWQYRGFIRSAHRVLRAARISRRQQWNQFRKVMKQLGRYELVRRRTQERRPVLVDEGTVHAAHNLFVHVDREATDAELQSFAECVPLPDVVVYLRSGEEQLIERTIRRGHPRIRDLTRPSVSLFVQQAIRAFDQVTSHKRVAARTVVIQDGAIVKQPPRQDSPTVKTVIDLLCRAVQSQAAAVAELPAQCPASGRDGIASGGPAC